MKDFSQKKLAAQSVVISTVLVFFSLILTLQYTLGVRDELASLRTNAQSAKDRLDALKMDGPTAGDISAFPAVSRLSPAEQERVTILLQKPSDIFESYDAWIQKQLVSMDDPNTKGITNIRKAYLSSTLPTLGDMYSDGGSLSLSQLISRIETKWLGERDIASFSEIGFASVAKSSSSTGALSDVLSLPISLQLKGSSRAIYSLVSDLSKSGKFPEDIYSNSGVLTLPGVSSFSNPLVRIKNFSSESTPAPDAFGTIEAKIELEFFVRSPSLSQYAEIVNSLKQRAEEKKAIINTVLKDEKESKKIELLRSYDRELTALMARMDPSRLSSDKKDSNTPAIIVDTLSRELRSIESRLSRINI